MNADKATIEAGRGSEKAPAKVKGKGKTAKAKAKGKAKKDEATQDAAA